MKSILRTEELFLLGVSVYVFSLLDYAWWWFPVLIFAPDVSMIGYIANTRIGALTYNMLHNRAVPISLYFIGLFFNLSILQLIGVILFAHISLDRVLGYGLKHEDSFKNTHLGKLA